MTCAEAESEFLAHERGEPTSEDFRAHLEGCAACARAFAEFAAAGRLLRELPAVGLERDLVASVRSARAERAVRWQPRLWLAPGLAAAAVVALVAIGLLRLQPNESGGPAAVATAPPVGDQRVALEPTRDPEVAAPAPSTSTAPDHATPSTPETAAPETRIGDLSAARTEWRPRRSAGLSDRYEVAPSMALEAAEPSEPEVRAGAGVGGMAALGMGTMLDEGAEPSADLSARGAAGTRGLGGPPGSAGAARGAMGGARGAPGSFGGGFGGGNLGAGAEEPGDGGGFAPPAPAAQVDGVGYTKGRPDELANDVAVPVYDFDFREAPVSDALRAISDRTGAKVGLPEGAAAQTPVTVRMEGVSARAALNRVCRAAGLRLQLRADGSLVVRPAPAAEASEPRR